VGERFSQFIYGFYPVSERWRLNLGFLVLLTCGPLALVAVTRSRPFHLYGLALLGITSVFVLAAGGVASLVEIETSKWGGLFVTLLLSVTAITCSVPVGVVLALGRGAKSPSLRALSHVGVEVIRGVPLLALLFMAVVLLPLFIPGGGDLNLFWRVVVGLCLYASAYMAEVIRGAFTALHVGQSEAARALGLTYWQATSLVLLPQAFRIALPNIVSTFVQVFKDSTLVLIVGVFDLLGVVQLTVADPKWNAYSAEAYLFAGVIFFTICFGLSRVAAGLERRLNRDRRVVAG
jgi:general L-amino acid transport system permease protein